MSDAEAADVAGWFNRSRNAVAQFPLICFVSAVVPLLQELLGGRDGARLRPMLHAVRGSWGERMCADSATPSLRASEGSNASIIRDAEEDAAVRPFTYYLTTTKYLLTYLLT